METLILAVYVGIPAEAIEKEGVHEIFLWVSFQLSKSSL